VPKAARPHSTTTSVQRASYVLSILLYTNTAPSGKRTSLLWTTSALDRPLSATFALERQLCITFTFGLATFSHFYFKPSNFMNRRINIQLTWNIYELKCYLVSMIIYILINIECLECIKGVCVVELARNQNVLPGIPIKSAPQRIASRCMTSDIHLPLLSKPRQTFNSESSIATPPAHSAEPTCQARRVVLELFLQGHSCLQCSVHSISSSP
jgi:hypothetical protein